MDGGPLTGLFSCSPSLRRCPAANCPADGQLLAAPLRQRNGYPYVLWARDTLPTTAMVNTYGAWPFVLIQESGAAGERCLTALLLLT